MRDSRPWAALLAAALVLSAGALAWPFTIDDAYIVARYAQNLAHGHGYAFNPGVTSDGVTGPIWLLPMGLGQWAGVSSVALAKGVDLVCGALAAALATRAGSGKAWLVALVIGTNAAFLPWTVGGLGIGVAALLLLLAAPEGASSRRSLVAGAMVGLLAWLRPEACVAGFVLLLGLESRMRGRALAVAIAGVALVVVFRLVLFGHAWPMALAAKPSTPWAGVDYVARGVFVCFGGFGLGLVAWALRAAGRGRVYAAAVLAQLVAIALAGGDWMPGYRLFAPIVPLYALASVEGLTWLQRTRPRAALGLGVVALALPLLFAGLELPELRASGHARESVAGPLADELGALAGPIALVDVGYLGYRSGAPIVDLGGVTDPVIAGSAGGYLAKHIDPAYLARRDPAALVLHAATAPEVDADGNLSQLLGYPVERRVAAMPFVRLRYRVERVVPYTPGYVYVLLVRRANP